MPPETTTPLKRAITNRTRAHLERQVSTRQVTHDLTTMAQEPLPEHVRAAVHAALDAEETHYTSPAGILPLREAIARRLDSLGYAVAPEALIVTNGGSEALYLALQTILAGGRLAVVEPADPRPVDMVQLAGGSVQRFATVPERRFLRTVDDLNLAGNAALLLSTPSTVTGVAMPGDKLRAIVEHALDIDVQPILDLSLAAARYEPSPGAMSRETVAETILIGSLSVSHALSGWRIGFLHAPEHLRGPITDLKTSISISTATVAQHAARAALEGPVDWLEARREQIRRRRDDLMAWSERTGFRVIFPDAYPVVLIDVADLGGGDVVARRLVEHDVLVHSGAHFGNAARDWIQINLGADDAALHAGLDRIAGLKLNT